MPGYRIVRLVPEPFVEDVDRLLDFTERVVREGQQPSRLRMLRPERDDLREAERGFPLAPQAVEQDAEVVVRIRMVGVDLDRRSICRLRIDDASLRAEDDAEVVVGVRVLRVESDRPLVRGGRFVQPEAILQDDPEIAVPVGPIGLELETPRDQRDGVVVSLLLMGEHSGEVQRAGMIGRDFEDAPVDLRSRRPLLGLLQHDRDRQRLVEAQGSVVTGRFRRPTTPPCSP